MRINTLLMFLSITTLLSSCGRGVDSSGAKRESSLLEVASANVTTGTQLELFFRDGYDYCILPHTGGHVWIMLKPRFEPFYKQMPHGQYSLSKQDFQKIQASGLASSTVLECLASHIENK